MSSVKCPQCNLTNWATAITCKRCGSFMQSPETVFVPPVMATEASGTPAEDSIRQAAADNAIPQTNWIPPAQQQDYQYQNRQYQSFAQSNYGGHRTAPQLKSGLAIASMILGVAGFVGSIFLVGLLVAPVALILGIVALVKANKHPHLYGGRGFAIAGIATSSIVVLFVPMIAAIAIPNLLAARRFANEAAAIATIKNISVAEKNYMAASFGKCGDIQTLIATRMLDVSLATGEKSGYRFIVINLPSGGCEIHATPLSLSTGTRSFFFSTEDNMLRGAAKKGAPADKNDFPVKTAE